VESAQRGGGLKMKASLRAKDPAYRVDRVAGQFGGGGHACAAGLSVEMESGAFCRALVAAVGAQIDAVQPATAAAATGAARASAPGAVAAAAPKEISL